MTNEDILFAAGFYEGEGYCRIHRNQVIVQVTQKDVEILVRLQGIFGGRIHFWGNQNVSQWVIYPPQSISFLSKIYPYLSKRRKRQLEKVGISVEKAA